jgi:hypothetical protein
MEVHGAPSELVKNTVSFKTTSKSLDEEQYESYEQYYNNKAGIHENRR